MNNNWVIYQHKNKNNNKSYIGKTMDIQDRWKNNGIKYKTCPRFWSAIVSYGWNNFEHIILEEKLSKEEADKKEIEYIKQYNTLHPNGYNLAEGGTGGNVWLGKTEEEKRIYSEKHQEETLSRGDEWHINLSKGIKRSWDDGTRDKEAIRIKISGINHTSSRQCRCVETNEVFGSYSEAAVACGCKRNRGSQIGKVIAGKAKTAFGYHWESITREEYKIILNNKEKKEREDSN